MNSASPEEQDRCAMYHLGADDDQALNSLIQRHGEKLLHYLIRQLRNEADAADLAQEVFVRVYQNRHHFDPRKKFSTWLYTIATNLVRNRFRWRSRHPEVCVEFSGAGEEGWKDFSSAAASPSDMLEAAERAEQVRQAVSQLPADLRTALILAEYQDLSTAEIASVTNSSIKSVESKLYRARQKLRHGLEKYLV